MNHDIRIATIDPASLAAFLDHQRHRAPGPKSTAKHP